MAERIMLEGIETLEDLVADGLDVLFVGYNPNPYAVTHGHYYARRANRFWEDLHESGLLPRILRGPGEDREILAHGLGLTDLIKRPTPNIDHLSAEEFRQGIARLDGLLVRHAPKIVCFNGLGLLEHYRRWGNPPEGLRVRAVPSTSPRNNGLRAERLAAFVALRREVDALRSQR